MILILDLLDQLRTHPLELLKYLVYPPLLAVFNWRSRQLPLHRLWGHLYELIDYLLHLPLLLLDFHQVGSLSPLLVFANCFQLSNLLLILLHGSDQTLNPVCRLYLFAEFLIFLHLDRVQKLQFVLKCSGTIELILIQLVQKFHLLLILMVCDDALLV